MRNSLFTHTLNVVFRLFWCVLLTFLSLIVLTALDVYLRALTLTAEQFLENLRVNFFVMFLLFLFAIEGSYVMSTVKRRQKIRVKEKSILEKVSLETRAQLTNGFKWTTLCLLIVWFAVVESGQFSLFSESVRSMIGWWSLPIYLLVLISLFLSLVLVDRWDWAVYNLEEFGRTGRFENLQKGLKDYNKALGSTLSIKRLLTISQCVEEGFLIGNDQEKEEMGRQLHVLFLNLKDRNVCSADRNLIDLSQSAEETVRRQKEVLGFEAKYPYRLVLWDTLRSSVGRVFPEVLSLLIGIAVLVILSYFGIKISFLP